MGWTRTRATRRCAASGRLVRPCTISSTSRWAGPGIIADSGGQPRLRHLSYPVIFPRDARTSCAMAVRCSGRAGPLAPWLAPGSGLGGWLLNATCRLEAAGPKGPEGPAASLNCTADLRETCVQPPDHQPHQHRLTPRMRRRQSEDALGSAVKGCSGCAGCTGCTLSPAPAQTPSPQPLALSPAGPELRLDAPLAPAACACCVPCRGARLCAAVRGLARTLWCRREDRRR